MKSITVRLSDSMPASIEAESRANGVSKFEAVRRRLEVASASTFFDLAGDLIGNVDDGRVPGDLSSDKKDYLNKRGYGKSAPQRKNLADLAGKIRLRDKYGHKDMRKLRG